jgi:hypothetical protein
MLENRTVPELASDVVRETRLLIRQHAALASAEFAETIRSFSRSGAQLAVALTLALLGTGALFAAVILGLVALGVAPWGAALIVGLASVIVAAVLARTAATALKREGFLPNTIATLKGHIEGGLS